MRAVIQRVSQAQVEVEEQRIAEMDLGLLVLVGVGVRDTARDADDLVRKIVSLRIFEDAAGKMNSSLAEVGGTLCLVSQFTLWADVRKGRRPSFGEAATPEQAEPLFDRVVSEARLQGVPVITGKFQAHMEVSLINSGPVTILFDTEKRF